MADEYASYVPLDMPGGSYHEIHLANTGLTAASIEEAIMKSSRTIENIVEYKRKRAQEGCPVNW